MKPPVTATLSVQVDRISVVVSCLPKMCTVKWPTAIMVKVPILVTSVSIKPMITETMVVEVDKVPVAAST